MPLVHAGTKLTTRYVLTTGNDANDGTSFERAHKTVAAAVASLPQANGHAHGKIILGPGQFVESATPIPLWATLAIEGVGSDPGGTTRSEIKLGNGRNTALFDYGASAGVGHNIIFRDLTIDGNKANNASATDPLIKIRRGGFNSAFERVTIRNANAEAIYIYGQAVNFALRSCAISSCGGAAIHHQNYEGGGVLLISDMQIDNCGEGLLYDYGGTGGLDTMSMVVIDGLKTESFSASGLMTHIIRHTPRPLTNGNQTTFIITGLVGNNTGGGVSSNNAIHEDAGTGICAFWLIHGVSTTNYLRAFGSTKTGQNSAGAHVSWAQFGSASGITYRPTREVLGLQEHMGISGTPEAAITAPVGSIAMRWNGTAGNTFYVKQSGTGNTGWGAVPTKLTGTKTQDWASIADGARAATTVTVTGAALGDTAVASMSVDLQGMEISAHVSATDTVTVVLRNGTGAPIDLASGTLKAVVTKA